MSKQCVIKLLMPHSMEHHHAALWLTVDECAALSARHLAGAHSRRRVADLATAVSCRRTLAAVHSGADLSAAIDGVLGYDAGECKGEHTAPASTDFKN
jgi:hypothetical protein